MTLEEWKTLMQIEEQAENDPEYKALKEEYIAAYQPFWKLWSGMPERDDRIIDDYLHAAIALNQSLMVQALRRNAK